LASCLLFATTGCETEQKFDNIKLVVENGTAFSVKTYLSSISDQEKAEKVRQYFLDVTQFINEAQSTGKVEPTLFREYVLTRVRDAVPDDYKLPIINALDISLNAYNSFYAANVREKIANLGKAKEVIDSIVAGIMVGVDPVSSNLGDTNPLEGFTDYKL